MKDIPTPTTPPDVNFGIYFPCPECQLYFSAWQSFEIHLIVDHWWDQAAADECMRQMVQNREQLQRQNPLKMAA